MEPYFDPAATLGPDDPLRAWLKDPDTAEFVKQRAIEHAATATGMDPSEAMGYSSEVPPLPQEAAPTSIFGRIKGALTPAPIKAPDFPNGVPLPRPYPSNIPEDTFRIDSGKPPPEESYPTQNNPLDPTPAAPTGVPLPAPRPAAAGPGASDVSGKKKGDLEGATNDFAKMAAGVKAIQPPPVNPVGTPQLPHHNAIQAAQVNQLLQLIGAQSRPDPIQTLGRLLVSGKA